MQVKFFWISNKVYKRYLKCIWSLIHIFISLFLSLLAHAQSLKGSLVWHKMAWMGKPRVGFCGKISSASTLTKSCEGGREVHPWAGIRRTRLGAPFSQLKTEISDCGLLQLGVNGSEFLASFRLQIDSTDRCEYSATSVDVFTHCFMLRFDLGT